MAVGTYALTSTDEVFAYLGKPVERNALWLYFAGTANTNTVQVNDSSLVLVDADNGTTTFDLTNASYDTLTELVAAINAIAGWEAGLIYHGSAASADLVTTGALDAEGVANKQTLKIKDVYLIERLIDRATDLIERYCNRLLKSRDYTREIYYGSGYNKLLLDQYPVTRVSRLSSGRDNAFSIRNTSSDANFCTVEITAAIMQLIVDGGANDDSADLTLSSYTTIDALIAAIVALGKGWTVTTLATDTATRDASELLIRPAMFVSSTAQAYCEIPDDDITDYKLLKPTEARNEGIIYRPTVFNPGLEYFVDYTAGYTTVPAALEQACIELVKYKYDQSQKDLNVKSERMGNVYEYTLADIQKGLPQSLIDQLDLFRRREF